MSPSVLPSSDIYSSISYHPRIYQINIISLAKLSKAVKVADTSNQGEAESKAFSPVTVALGEDTKPFEKTDGVFNKDMFS